MYHKLRRGSEGAVDPRPAVGHIGIPNATLTNEELRERAQEAALKHLHFMIASDLVRKDSREVGKSKKLLESRSFGK